MTEIPEPTKEDFEQVEYAMLRYAGASRAALKLRSQGKPESVIIEDLMLSLRLLSHFQRETERLKAELKSTLADSERLDWLDSEYVYSEGMITGLCGRSIFFSGNNIDDIRQAIDERRGA